MKSFGILIFLCIVIVVAVSVLSLLVGSKKSNALHLRKKAILSDNEHEFFYRLLRALPDYHIFPQVSFSALLDVDKKITGKEFYSQRGRFSQKRADFVICEPETLDVLAIIELDDRTHTTEKNQKRDALTEAAGYRTIRFQSTRKPCEAEIAAFFAPTKQKPEAFTRSADETRKESSLSARTEKAAPTQF